jgi:hypothetical protein
LEEITPVSSCQTPELFAVAWWKRVFFAIGGRKLLLARQTQDVNICSDCTFAKHLVIEAKITDLLNTTSRVTQAEAR